MPATPLPAGELLTDNAELDASDFSALAACAEAVAPAPAPEPQPRSHFCPQCRSTDSWGQASWCPKCGYFPRLGVTIDPETAAASAAAAENSPAGDGDGSAQPVTAGDAGLLAGLAQIPAWARVLAAGWGVVLAVSVAARFLTPENSWARFGWAVGQILAGAIAFLVAHSLVYLELIRESDRFKLFDYFLKPVGIWEKMFSRLPRTQRRIWLAGWGLSAVFFSLVIIQGIPWMAMFEGESRGTADNRLLREITKRAKELEKESTSLEDAVSQVGDESPEESATPAVVKEETLDCVVLGYTVDPRTGVLDELLLAAVVDGELAYAGNISSGLSAEQRKQLDALVRKHPRERPFVPTKLTAEWVQPRITCRVAHDGWTSRGTLKSPRFQSLLQSPR